MRTGKTILLAVAAAVVLGAVPGSGGEEALAQHLISTKAGFVNRTEGRVEIERYGSVDEERGRASTGTQMRKGDRLSTQADGLAEVLLNPGTYLRLSPRTEIRAVETNLANIHFELVRGSIILEVGEVGKTAPIQLDTPQGPLTIQRDGLHRIEASGGVTRIAVRQGDIWTGVPADVLRKQGVKIGRGKLALLQNGTSTPQIAKLDKDQADDFDRWSFSRAQTLVAANNMALRDSRTLTSLSPGWFFNPLAGSYTFIPRNGLFFSPYGFGFFNSFANCFTCFGNFFRGPWGNGVPVNNGQGGLGGGSLGSAPARVITGADRTPIQREVEGRRAEFGDAFGRGRGIEAMDGFGGRSMGNRSMGMPSSPVIIAAPMPTRGGGGAVGGGDAGGGRPAGPSRP
jgi:hypothetical protein